MTSQTPEKFLIHNQNELKTHLSLGFEIFIPEFQKEIELTREELDELKRKIIENKENKVEIEKILKKITIDKVKKTLDTEETTVAGLTGVKTEQLKDDVENRISNNNSTQQQSTKQTPQKPATLKTEFENMKEGLSTDPIGRAKENKGSAALLGLGVGLIGYTGYKLLSGIFGGSDSKKDDNKDKEKAKEGFIDFALDKLGIKGEFAVWAKRMGFFGLVVAGIGGAFFGKDKIKEYFDKILGFFGVESKEEKEAYEKFAKKISDSEGKEVKPETLKKIKGEKVKDIISGTGFFTSIFEMVKNKVYNIAPLPDFTKTWLKKTGISNIDELKELSYIRDYLIKKEENKELSYGDDTILDSLVKMDSGEEKLKKQVKDSTLVINGAGIIPGTITGENSSSQESGKNNDSDIGNPGVILSARTYQLWHGTIKPFIKMDSIQKGFVLNSISGFFDHFNKKFKNKEFTEVKKILPEIEVEFEVLKSLPNPSEAEILKMTYLDRQINAIKGGKNAYKEFVLLVDKGPEGFIRHIESIDTSRLSNLNDLKSIKNITAKNIQEFGSISREIQKVMDDKELLVKGIIGEIETLNLEKLKLIEEAKKGVDNSVKIAQIENEVLSKNGNIGDIQQKVKSLFEEFKVKNEKHFVDLLKSKKDLKLFGKMKEVMGRDLEIKDFDIDTEKKFFRFGTYKGALILTGIGAGVTAFTSKNKDGSVNWSEIGHTAGRVGAGFVPIVGTGWDAIDAYKAFSKGDMKGGIANTGAFVASLSGDILLGISLLGGVTTPIGVGAKVATGGIRTAIKEFIIGGSKTTKILRRTVVGGTAVAVGFSVEPLISYVLNGDKLEQSNTTDL